MSDADQLAAIGLKLTAALTSAYACTDSGAALVFLPGGVTVPGDIAQSGVVNAAQMETFLETNFDSPFIMSPSDGAVHGKDLTYGTASELYTIAATSAVPLGSATDDSWKRVAAEIAGAQRNLPSAGMDAGLVCEPDDWVLSSNTGYWTTFDSTQTQPAQTTSSAATPPVVRPNPSLWVMRTPAMVPLHFNTPSVVTKPPRPAPAQMEAIRSPAIAAVELKERPIGIFGLPPRPYGSTNPPPPPPPPSQSISVRLQHQCVTLGYMSGGQPWWSAPFLADTGWYIPGMARGALLPVPQSSAANGDLAYGRPVAMIVVQGLVITGNWTNKAAASIGSVGPFSLVGATTTSGTNGVVTFSRQGMQVVALLCSRLPVLPPSDAPTATTGTTMPASSGTTSATGNTGAETAAGNATTSSSQAQSTSGSATSATPSQAQSTSGSATSATTTPTTPSTQTPADSGAATGNGTNQTSSASRPASS